MRVMVSQRSATRYTSSRPGKADCHSSWPEAFDPAGGCHVGPNMTLEPTDLRRRGRKRYCPEQCADRVKKRRKKEGTLSPNSAPIPSVIRGSNGVLIARVATLGYLGGPRDTVLDVTYGRGLWSTMPPGVPHRWQGRLRDRPEVDSSVDVVCFDVGQALTHLSR